MNAPALNGAREDGEATDRAATVVDEILAERGWQRDVMTLREIEGAARTQTAMSSYSPDA